MAPAEAAEGLAAVAAAQPVVPRPVLASPAPAGVPWAWIATVIFALVAGYYLAVSQVGQGGLLIVIILLILAAAAGYETGRRGGRRP